MVEDGHLANSHPYGSSTYYLDNLNTKRNNSHHNNNNNSAASNSCVVVVERDKRGKPVASVTPGSFVANTNDTSESVVVSVTANNIANNHLDNHLPTNATNSKSTTTSLHIEKSLNSAFTRQQSLAGVTLTPESNGSSHMADHVDTSAAPPHHNHHPHPTSHGRHRFFDVVTKDTDYSGSDMLTSGSTTGGTQGVDGNFPPEIHKTAMAFGILIFNFFLTTTSLAIIHDKVPPYGPLPDAILGAFEAHTWALIVSEVLIILTTGIMLIIIITHRHRFIIFRRLFLMLSLLYFMRSVTMFVTVLPVSSKTYFCSPKTMHPDFETIFSRSMSLFFGMGLTLNGKHVYCGDYIYSGHTTILVMSYLMISEYSPRRVRWLHWATWLMSLTGVFMVLLSHSHYTVDVIIGYFVTTRLFWMYHTCANNQFLKKSVRYNYLSREWWYFLFQYFECNVNGPLQPLEYR